jgi:NodT family efflux transporter outer membrane factor (OMF) lipoprotein
MKRLLPLLLLGGCATVAPTPLPQSLVPAGHVSPVAPPTQGPTLQSVLAADPALAHLLAAARAGSPDLETAAARVLQARAGLKSARAQSLPQIDANVSANQQRQSLEQFGFDAPPGLIPRERSVFQPSIEASWELDLFGRLAAGRTAAAARLDAATADAEAIRLSLETEIARNLLAVRALDARQQAASEARDSALALDRLARVRAKAGLATGLDTATTQADVSQAEAALPPLRADRTARIAALSRLTGLSVAGVAQLVAAPAPLPAADAWHIPDIPSDLLQRRPDIRAAQGQLRAADAGVAEALAARYPQLTLTGSLGWLSETIAGLFTGDSFTALASGTLAGPLLDFGRTAAEVQRNRGVAAEATARYRAAVLDALADVETELASARGARDQAARLEQAALALQTARRLAETQYRGGLTDARAVSESARRLADAQDRRIAVEGEAIDAALRLELASGGPLVQVGGTL